MLPQLQMFLLLETQAFVFPLFYVFVTENWRNKQGEKTSKSNKDKKLTSKLTKPNER